MDKVNHTDRARAAERVLEAYAAHRVAWRGVTKADDVPIPVGLFDALNELEALLADQPDEPEVERGSNAPWIRDCEIVPRLRARLAAHGLQLVINTGDNGEVYDLYATEKGRIVCTSNETPKDLLDMLDEIDERGVWWREQNGSPAELTAKAGAITKAVGSIKTSPTNRLDPELRDALTNLENTLRAFLDEAYIETDDEASS